MTLPYTLDDGTGSRARLGLIVLQTDETLETEARSAFDLPGVALFHTRIANDLTVTEETLTAMRDRLPAAAAMLPTPPPSIPSATAAHRRPRTSARTRSKPWSGRITRTPT